MRKLCYFHACTVHTFIIYTTYKFFSPIQSTVQEEGEGEWWWVLARGSRRGRHLTVLGGAIKIRLNYTVIVSNFVVLYNLMLFWKPLLLVILEWMAMVWCIVKPNQILNFGCAPPARLSYVIFVDRTAASQQNHYVFLCLQKLQIFCGTYVVYILVLLLFLDCITKFTNLRTQRPKMRCSM